MIAWVSFVAALGGVIMSITDESIRSLIETTTIARQTRIRDPSHL